LQTENGDELRANWKCEHTLPASIPNILSNPIVLMWTQKNINSDNQVCSLAASLVPVVGNIEVRLLNLENRAPQVTNAAALEDTGRLLTAEQSSREQDINREQNLQNTQNDQNVVVGVDVSVHVVNPEKISGLDQQLLEATQRIATLEAIGPGLVLRLGLVVLSSYYRGIRMVSSGYYVTRDLL